MKSKITPPELAKEWGIDPEKVIAWIRRGELHAINVAADPNGKRPRYLIDREDIARFEQGRAIKPPTPKPRRRRKRCEEIGSETFGF